MGSIDPVRMSLDQKAVLLRQIDANTANPPQTPFEKGD